MRGRDGDVGRVTWDSIPSTLAAALTAAAATAAAAHVCSVPLLSGAPDDTYITTEFRSFLGVSAFSALLAGNAQVAMRWTGEFRASESGPMSFYIHSARQTNVLYIDGIEVTRGKSSLATAMETVGTIFVTEKQWYKIELQHHQRSSWGCTVNVMYQRPAGACSGGSAAPTKTFPYLSHTPLILPLSSRRALPLGHTSPSPLSC